MISIVIPHMIGAIGADNLLKRCINSFKSAAHEFIVVANDGMGYGAATNVGLSICNGDYIIVSNNDIELISGNLSDMKEYSDFSVPNILPEPRDYLPRAFFGMPRDVYEFIVNEYGYFYDERFEMGYFEDDDLIQRIEQSELYVRKCESVTVSHLNGGGFTMKQVGEQKYFDINKEIFEEKWS